MKPNIRSVDFNLLLLFEAIYRTRNLTVAGQRVGISPSAASHALARLRETFNDPLFVRMARSLEPTPLADQMADQTSSALDAVRAIFDRKGFEPASAQRLFRIAMSDVDEHLMLPRLAKLLSERAPGVSIQTSAPTVRALQEGLANGAIDMAFGYLPGIRGEIRQQLLRSTRYACVVRVGHPVVGAALTREKYLSARHVLAFPAGATHGEDIEQALRGSGLQGTIAMKVRQFLAVPNIVNDTDMIGTIPRILAESHLSLKLQVFAPPIELPQYELKAYWHERYNLEPAIKWLRSQIATLFIPPQQDVE